jgi:hypothetical protein
MCGDRLCLRPRWNCRAASNGSASCHTKDEGLNIVLHIDYRGKAAYAMRRQSRRGLCLNLGPGRRYLLAGDLDIQETGSAFGTGSGDVPEAGIVRRYLRRDTRCAVSACAWIRVMDTWLPLNPIRAKARQ